MTSISLLVHDLWNFGDLGFLQLVGAGGLEGGVWGHGVCPHTCAHVHTHTCTCIHVKWLSLGEFPMMSYAYTDLYACMHTWDIPAHPHQPPESVKIQ